MRHHEMNQHFEVDVQTGSVIAKQDARARASLGRLRSLAGAGLTVTALAVGAALPLPVAAAEGYAPTYHSTGSVSCEVDLITKRQTITVQPGAMSAGIKSSDGFAGTFLTQSAVLYSYDGLQWHLWYATPVQSATTTGTGRTAGYGALAPQQDQRTFGINGTPFFVLVAQIYAWLDSNGNQIGNTQILLVDYYIETTKSASDPTGLYTQSRGATGCRFR